MAMSAFTCFRNSPFGKSNMSRYTGMIRKIFWCYTKHISTVFGVSSFDREHTENRVCILEMVIYKNEEIHSKVVLFSSKLTLSPVCLWMNQYKLSPRVHFLQMKFIHNIKQLRNSSITETIFISIMKISLFNSKIITDCQRVRKRNAFFLSQMLTSNK